MPDGGALVSRESVARQKVTDELHVQRGGRRTTREGTWIGWCMPTTRNTRNNAIVKCVFLCPFHTGPDDARCRSGCPIAERNGRLAHPIAKPLMLPIHDVKHHWRKPPPVPQRRSKAVAAFEHNSNIQRFCKRCFTPPYADWTPRRRGRFSRDRRHRSARSTELLSAVRLFNGAVHEQSLVRIMWHKYEYREKRIRRGEIVAIWAIVAAILLGVAALSGL